MKKARVSIVIPLYNAARYLAETLESVRCQSFADWELILVDDGSTDASAEVVNEYLAGHPQFATLLSHPLQENRGTSASRNLGMKQAGGEFICFLDADDLWEPDFLQFYVDLLDSRPDLSLAYGPALLYYGSPEKDRVQKLGISAEAKVDSARLFQKFLVGKADTPSPSGVIMRHDAVLQAGGWEECFRGMYDDQVLYSKLLLQGAGVFVTERCLYKYRQHDTSICKQSVKAGLDYQSRMVYLEWLQRYLASSGHSLPRYELIIAEQIWYVESHNESISHNNNRIVKAARTARRFISFLARQKGFYSRVKVSLRILVQQIKYLFA